MLVTRLKKSGGIASRLRNPPITTTSAPAARQRSKIARLNSACDANVLRLDHRRGNAGLVGRTASPRAAANWKSPTRSSPCKRAGRDLSDQVAERRAAAGNQYGNANEVAVEKSWHCS